MARIIPVYKKFKEKIPSWLDLSTIKEASQSYKETVKEGLSKVSSTRKTTSQYVCKKCTKIYNTTSIKKLTSNKKISPLTCPSCGDILTSYSTVPNILKESSNKEVYEEKKVDLVKEAEASGVYNTFLDRRIVYNLEEKLADYARKKGMTNCIARYKRGEHVKESNAENSSLNNFEFELEWLYDLKKKARVTAYAKLTPSGKIIFPKVFKTASGMEYPFEKEYVEKLRKDPKLFSSINSIRKTDIPTFRRKDPTRFKVAGAMKVGEYKEEKNKNSL